jgi:hypothetical protein
MFISGSYEKTLSGEFSFPLEHLRTIYVLPSFLIIVITLSAFILNYKAVSIRYFLVWVAASMLGMAFLRTVPLIVMTMVPILFIKYKRGDFKKLDLGDSVHYIALAACFIIAVNLGYLTWNGEVYKAVGTNFHRPGLGKHPRFSDPVVEYARKKYAGQHSFNNYNSGTYLIWKWWPDKKVFIDSKSSAYRVDFLEEYKNTYSPRLIEKYNLGHVILPLNSKLIYFYFVPHPQWEIEVMDESFVLFVKREKAVNRNPEDFIIQSSLELKKLHWREAKNLQEVLSFISKHQNDESKLEKYLSYTQWRWN